MVSFRNPPGEKKSSDSRCVTPLPGIIDYCQKDSKAEAASSALAVHSFTDYMDHLHVHRAQAVMSPFEYTGENDLNHIIKEQVSFLMLEL